MRHLDLFSGIGGFALGLEATQQIKTVAFCEIDKYCTKVLNKNWPEVPVYNDIKELTHDKLKADGIDNIDIITGGYPCQPFSVAGNKKGVEDPRHLWPEYFRLIKECRPTWVIGENVAGHIKLGLDAVQEDLESEGYSLRTFSISASSIGAPHQRERVWTVAYSERNGLLATEKRESIEETIRQQPQGENNTFNIKRAGSIPVSTSDVEDTRRRSWREQFTRNKESVGRGTSEKTERSTNSNTTTGSSEGTTTMANGNKNKNNWWHTEPNVGRVADGVSDRTHRLKSLGNAVVPQIPYYIAKSILEVRDA
jgi:DNA (cytosine-5)-methyltransferase 1|tara:strand:+ start:932 stop:1861 length:930 start_codon:yes stop_codon:yes gene_type:complete